MLLAILAQGTGDTGGSGPDWADLAQYGVLGLVVLAFIFGKIVPGYIYERRVAEYEAEKAENRRLEDSIKEKVIPTLLQATDVLAQVLAFLNRWADERPPTRKRT